MLAENKALSYYHFPVATNIINSNFIMRNIIIKGF